MKFVGLTLAIFLVCCTSTQKSFHRMPASDGDSVRIELGQSPAGAEEGSTDEKLLGGWTYEDIRCSQGSTPNPDSMSLFEKQNRYSTLTFSHSKVSYYIQWEGCSAEATASYYVQSSRLTINFRQDRIQQYCPPGKELSFLAEELPATYQIKELSSGEYELLVHFPNGNSSETKICIPQGQATGVFRKRSSS